LLGITLDLQNGFFDNRIEEDEHDVAVTDVMPDTSIATVGDIVTIDVTVENEGDFPETADVTAYYDAIEIDTVTGVALAVAEVDVISIPWDTTGIPLDTYTISATISVVPEEVDIADNSLIDGTVEIIEALPPHDIAVTNVSPSDTLVNLGDTVTILVTVENQGTESDTFDLTAFYDGTIVATMLGITLGSGAEDSYPFLWDTSLSGVGTFTVSANASVVPGEEDTDDNQFIDGTVEVVEGAIIHDVAVLNVVPSPTTVAVGDTVNIEVTVQNQGTEPETFGVTVFFDGTIICGTTRSLNPIETDIVDCPWDTTGVPLGTYLISANASEVECEVDIDDNQFIDGEVQIIDVIPEPATVTSCESDGSEQNMFKPEDNVYACGENYGALESVTVYVVPNGGPYTAAASIFSTAAQTDGSGILGPTDLGTYELGEYDLWVDRNGNGLLDEEREPVDTFGATSGFLVIPEYLAGTILGLAGCFIAFLTFRYFKKKR
jgi:hypothetical protein